MAAFTPGNIVVYRVGTSSSTSSAASATFLDEYTPQGVFVQTIALPTTTSGSQDALTDSSSAGSAGEISDIGNGSGILTAGYDAPVGTSSVTGTNLPRVVGIVSANGSVDTSTANTTYATDNFRSAASADGTNIYVATNTGVGYTTAGSTAAPVMLTSGTTAAANQVVVSNGQLYYSTGSGYSGTQGIYALGTGTPTTAGQTSTLIAASSKPYAFAFVALGGSATPNTLYVADGTSGVEKFSLSNGTYSATGTVAVSGVEGLTVSVSGNTATLFVTTSSTIQTIVDTSGAGGTLTATPTTIVTAGTGNDPAGTFKGDALTPQTVCYCTGTLIRTVRGDVAVEDLAVGDLAVTTSGARRPIVWIGHRVLDCRNHPSPNEVMPVRISAHAFGPNRPARDLYVSPGHAICVDLIGEVLIPAAALVNGTTIQQIEMDSVTYWHVELDSHDIILAENLPAESYLDMENRTFFKENGVVAFNTIPPDASSLTHADFCRPFHMDGTLVEAARTQLSARAKAIGWTLDADGILAGLHLVCDGIRVEPVRRGLTVRFAVPAQAQDVWLVSATSRPCEIGDSGDSRDLGVCVSGLTIDDGFDAHAIDLADPLLCIGFHPLEENVRLWTAGRARLPAALWAQHHEAASGGFFLRVDLASGGLPRWVAPSVAPAAIKAPHLELVARRA